MARTHDYAKAINYYEAAVRNGSPAQAKCLVLIIAGQAALRYDLAELYLRLHQLDKAEKVINTALEHEDNADLATLQADVRYFSLMARVHRDAEKTPMVCVPAINTDAQAIMVLAKAREAQLRVLQRVGHEQPDALRHEQLVDILYLYFYYLI